VPEVPFPRARHGGSVNGVAFSPHGTLLASAYGHDTVQTRQVSLFADPYARNNQETAMFLPPATGSQRARRRHHDLQAQAGQQRLLRQHARASRGAVSSGFQPPCNPSLTTTMDH
jgi:hypothetical protein